MLISKGKFIYQKKWTYDKIASFNKKKVFGCGVVICEDSEWINFFFYQRECADILAI